MSIISNPNRQIIAIDYFLIDLIRLLLMIVNPRLFLYFVSKQAKL